jgi:hypothetical protein
VEEILIDDLVAHYIANQEVDSVACAEQIEAVARLTSSATRLVDSIFRSYEDHLTMASHHKASAKKTIALK